MSLRRSRCPRWITWRTIAASRRQRTTAIPMTTARAKRISGVIASRCRTGKPMGRCGVGMFSPASDSLSTDCLAEPYCDVTDGHTSGSNASITIALPRASNRPLRHGTRLGAFVAPLDWNRYHQTQTASATAVAPKTHRPGDPDPIDKLACEMYHDIGMLLPPPQGRQLNTARSVPSQGLTVMLLAGGSSKPRRSRALDSQSPTLEGSPSGNLAATSAG